MSEQDERAFPLWHRQPQTDGTYTQFHAGGLTKRELISALVMARIARPSLTQAALQLRAQVAVAHADALLEELKRGRA